jgi:hypothetical protein
MRKLVHIVSAGALLFTVVAAPGQALATSGEDALEECSYPTILDVAVMRPLGLASVLVGFALWVPLGPWTVFTSTNDVGKVTNKLLTEPMRFTFARPVGDCAVGHFR